MMNRLFCITYFFSFPFLKKNKKDQPHDEINKELTENQPKE
jgi:hypothetical protein